MTYKNTLFSFLIILVIAFMPWVHFLHHTSATNAAPISQAPDAYMEEVSSLALNKFGKPSLRIVTPKLIHFAQNDKTELTTPLLTLYRESPEPWYITATSADATDGVNNVLFKENVVIHHAADINNPATVIKTPTLMVHPNLKTAETTDPITMVQPSIIVNAIGMHADMNTGDIKLLSQARGEYVPNS